MTIRSITTPVYAIQCDADECTAEIRTEGWGEYFVRRDAEAAGWQLRPLAGNGSRSAPDLCPRHRTDVCVRCQITRSAGVCCSSHRKELCHRCYRLTHFVEVCGEGCTACAAEGLPVVLDGRTDR